MWPRIWSELCLVARARGNLRVVSSVRDCCVSEFLEELHFRGRRASIYRPEQVGGSEGKKGMALSRQAAELERLRLVAQVGSVETTPKAQEVWRPAFWTEF